MTTPFIFDRVAVSQTRSAAGAPPAGALFKERPPTSAKAGARAPTVFAEVGNWEIAPLLEATGKPVEDGQAANITRTANSHQNDGQQDPRAGCQEGCCATTRALPAGLTSLISRRLLV